MVITLNIYSSLQFYIVIKLNSFNKASHWPLLKKGLENGVKMLKKLEGTCILKSLQKKTRPFSDIYWYSSKTENGISEFVKDSAKSDRRCKCFKSQENSSNGKWCHILHDSWYCQSGWHIAIVGACYFEAYFVLDFCRMATSYIDRWPKQVHVKDQTAKYLLNYFSIFNQTILLVTKHGFTTLNK